MSINRNLNYHNLNRSRKSAYKFDATTLRSFVSFVLSIDNPKIRKSDLYGLKSLIDSFDMEYYMKDQVKVNLLKILQKGLELVIEGKITNGKIIESHINFFIENSEDINESFRKLTDEEITYISMMIRKYNSRRYFFDNVDDIIDLLTAAKMANALEIDQCIDKVCRRMEEVTRDHNIAGSEFDSDYVDLEDFTFEQNLTEAYNVLNNPSNVLQTGMQGFNELLGGGIELSRGYVIMGISGEGKSGFLLNLAVQIKNNNRFYQTKDPNLKPCVVYISQENSKIETLERLYNITTDIESMTVKPLDQVIHDMRTKGNMIISDDNPMNLAIIYKEPFTNDTSFFHEVIDTMKERGYEVVCILHDYLQRINSANPNYRGDIRLELGAIMNEECTIAKNRHIAFVTVGQLNRTADDKIAESKERNKKNLIAMIRRSHIGESIQILHNADVVMVAAREYDDEEDRLYFGIHKVKGRDKGQGRMYTYQPFVKGSTIKLEEDLGKDPVHKDTLAPIIGIQGAQKKASQNISSKIKNLDASQGDISGILSKRRFGLTASVVPVPRDKPTKVPKNKKKQGQNIMPLSDFINQCICETVEAPWSIRKEVYQKEPPWFIRKEVYQVEPPWYINPVFCA